MKEIEGQPYTVSFGYLWRIGVLDVSRLNAEKYKDESDGLWKYKYNSASDECYMNEHATQIEVINLGGNSMDFTKKGGEQAKAIFEKYGLKYIEKYLIGRDV